MKVADFDLAGRTVTLSHRHTKNNRDCVQPLAANLCKPLKDSFKGKLPQARALAMPSKHRAAAMFRADAQAAGIDLDPERGLWDFHSLRHTFGTLLAAAGVHPKTAQDLMRHSDINLTMSRYTHTLRGQAEKAIDSLPDLSQPSKHDLQRQKATGTDGKASQLAHQLAQNMQPNAKKQDETGLPIGQAGNSQNIMKQGLECQIMHSKPLYLKGERGDSNPRPLDPQSSALTN